MDEQDIIIKRDYLVVKSNQLVQKSRYELSVTEQRAVAYICSLIKPLRGDETRKNTPYKLEYEFSIKDYAQICGLYEKKGGKLYKEIRDTIERLMQKILKLELPNGDEVMIAWLVTAHFVKDSGNIKIRLNEDMIPYLFDLQEKFTAYGLLNILAMKSQYSIRVYELLKSYEYKGIAAFETEELKKILMVHGKKAYERFFNFSNRILDPAIAEINSLTDIDASYKTKTKGRKVIQVIFSINQKTEGKRDISHTRINYLLNT